MMSLFLWSQLVVSLALLLDLLSFQLRDRRRILACLALSCALNAAHFALLGQRSAASLLLLASVRFLVSIWLVHRILMWFFMGLACAAALDAARHPLLAGQQPAGGLTGGGADGGAVSGQQSGGVLPSLRAQGGCLLMIVAD